MLFKKKRPQKLTGDLLLQRQVPRLLRQVDPMRNLEQIEQLLSLVLFADIKLDRFFLQWLQKSLGDKANRIFRTALKKIQTQLSFEISSQHGWCIAWMSNDDNDDSSVTQVACASLDGSVTGEVAAAIWCGDHINMISNPKIWWRVHEIRPETKTILLLEIDITTSIIKSKSNYHETYLIYLLGATIRRTTELSNHSHRNKYNINTMNTSLISNNVIEYFFQLPKPNISEAVSFLKSEVEEQKRLAFLQDSSNDDIQDHSMKQLQQKALIQLWNERKNNENKAKLILNSINNILIYHNELWIAIGRALKIISRGRSTLLQSWMSWCNEGISSKNAAVQANRGTGRDWDRYLSRVKRRVTSCRAAWDLQRVATNCDDPVIARARGLLRSYLSNKQLECVTDDILSQYHDVLYHIPYAQDILDLAVEAVEDRPLRFLPCLLSQSYNDDEFDINFNHHSNNNNSNNNGGIENKSVSRVALSQRENNLKSINYHFKHNNIQVPMAIYETKLIFSNKINKQNITNNNRYNIKSSKNTTIKTNIYENDYFEIGNTRLVHMSEIEAIIQVNDAIGLQGGYGEGTEIYWHIVTAVDILMGRLQLISCEPPPLCWLQSEEASLTDIEMIPMKIWLSIAHLWGVSVAREGEGEGEGEGEIEYEPAQERDNMKLKNEFKHIVFMTPIPPANEALTWLQKIALDYPVISEEKPLKEPKPRIQPREIIREPRRKRAWR